VAGDDDPGLENNTDIYDPSTNTFVVGPMLTDTRNTSVATTLADGRVLIAGGFGNVVNGVLSSTDLYDPATNTVTAGPSMTTARVYPTATLLPNGKVLIAGGNGDLNTTDIYDPVSNTFSAGPLMNIGRRYATAALLPNGKVLIAGGQAYGIDPVSVELYDPASNTFAASTPSMNVPRWVATATLLPNGKVLIAGGENETGPIFTPTAVELYDPVSNTFAASPPSLNLSRSEATATLLPNGKVLVAGGYGHPLGQPLKSCELYLP
jgi:hypothetical protein